ncbi:MAG: efflux RND transporter periplasmic adaptor subunit [Gemmatimonadaceae bacterium]
MTFQDRIAPSHVRSAALLALLALATGACNSSDAAGAAGAPAAVTVGEENVAIVQRDTLHTGPAVSGTLAPEQVATVRAELSGTVLGTHAEAGQRVTQGALLARVDDRAVRDQVLSARTAVTAAEGSYEVAQREAQRSTTLLAAGAIAERDMESATRAADAARAQLANARAQLASAEKALDATRVTAPFTGIVSDRAVGAGDVVAPGTAMYTIVDPSTMRYEASVPAERLGDVRVGAPVRFHVSGYPERQFEGRITRVNPVADPSTRQVRLLVSVPNSGGQLVGGLFAEGRVSSRSIEALVVPEAAVDQRGITPTVYRVSGGKVERVPVTMGLHDQQTERVEITSGVAVGDTLLTGAAQGVTPGSSVTIGKVKDAPPAGQPVAPSTTPPPDPSAGPSVSQPGGSPPATER